MTGGYSSLLVLALILMEFPPFSSSLLSSSAPPAPPVPLTDEQKNRAISALEFNLLKRFGLSTRPRPGRDIVIPQYMIDLYRQQTNDDTYIPPVFRRGKAVDAGNTVRSFHHEERVPLHGCSEHNCARIWFDVTNIPADDMLTAAEMRIYVERNATHEPDPNKVIKHKLQVFEIMKPVSKHIEPVSSRLIAVQDVIVQNSSWVTLDVSPAVFKWKNKPRFNHGLEVRLLDNRKTMSSSSSSPLKHVRLRRSTEVTESQWNIERPLLVAFSDDRKSSRTRRDANSTNNKKRKRKRNSRKCEKGKKGRKCRRKKKKKNRKDKGKNPSGKRRRGHKNLCRRHPLYVDFNDVGWNDWIVAPLGYEAYYCDGNCPFPLTDNLNTTNHAIVQTLVNSVDSKAAPTACCVPTSLSSISMLYTDEFDKVILKQYDEMIVEGCGCR